MKFKLAVDDQDKEKFNYIIKTYHSYVPTISTVGRSLKWLIYDDADLYTILGAISLGSSTYPPCKDFLRYLNITKFEYKKIFNQFANNNRFCLCVKRKNLGTQVLKELRHQAPIEWKKKYNNDLKYLITFVGGGHHGAIYKADNWTHIGFTSGLPSHKSISMKWDTGTKLKQNFVKPTGENKKMIFIKEL